MICKHCKYPIRPENVKDKVKDAWCEKCANFVPVKKARKD